ncbi:hypothetical protein ASD04_09710 [Devosia sp. Root436]|uniref:hypothetical protein n=1 Tax=Devosia sp. Root436 TaxID=1736537 RepID=UPI0006FB5BFC|nr:hypothetical protein [Devosia sp. Root436]KQX38912.1 hypothetical protein ASD04_09710 [Devosia sp. Root436]
MSNKTFAFAFAIASIAGFAAAMPAQAATRSVDIHPELFASRCIAQGGAIAAANPTLACQTPETTIVCSFMTLNIARCEWPGIEGQVAVNRIIGMQDAEAVGGSSGAIKKGGGFKLPDLPLDNGNGGGGIDLPDLPIKWN